MELLWYERAAAWALLLTLPFTYFVLILCFSFMRIIDWSGSRWSDVTSGVHDVVADLWSAARHGR